MQVISADLVALPESSQPPDVVWLHLFYHDLHTALLQTRGATPAGFYTIEPDGKGAFQVKVMEPGPDNGKVVSGFATWGKAQDWINDRMRNTKHGVDPKGWT